MLENLISPEYISGQLNNPEESSEYDIPDPFAQFLPPNDGLIIKEKPKVSKKKRVAKKIITEILNKITETQNNPSQQGFVPQDKPRLSPQLPFEPGEISNLRQMTALRENQDAGQRAFEQLEKNLTPMGLGLQILLAASPLGARGMARPSNLSGPVGMNNPSPATPAPVTIPPREAIASPNKPMIPSSGLSPRGDAHKFTPAGGKQYLNRQARSAGSSPEWVKEGAQALLDKFLGMGKKPNPFLPKRRGLDMNVENLVNAGKNIPENRADRLALSELRPEARSKGFTSMKEYAEALEMEALLGTELTKAKYDLIKQSLAEEKMMNLKLNQHLRNKNREF
jgi:hypothetical protein